MSAAIDYYANVRYYMKRLKADVSQFTFSSQELTYVNHAIDRLQTLCTIQINEVQAYERRYAASPK